MTCVTQPAVNPVRCLTRNAQTVNCSGTQIFHTSSLSSLTMTSYSVHAPCNCEPSSARQATAHILWNTRFHYRLHKARHLPYPQPNKPNPHLPILFILPSTLRFSKRPLATPPAHHINYLPSLKFGKQNSSRRQTGLKSVMPSETYTRNCVVWINICREHALLKSSGRLSFTSVNLNC
jgi:hypothetical protein